MMYWPIILYERVKSDGLNDSEILLVHLIVIYSRQGLKYYHYGDIKDVIFIIKEQKIEWKIIVLSTR